MNKKALVVLFAILGACLVLYLVKIVQNINQPQIEYSEGLMVYLSRLFGSGQWSWGIADSPPYLVSYYPPMFYIVMGQIYNWFGESLLVGRLFVLCTTVVSMVLVGLIVYYVTRSKVVAVIGALLPLTQQIVWGWSWFMKVDMPAVMLELAGIYIALKFVKSNSIYMSLPFFLLAVFTKQTALAGVIAVCLFLFLQYRRQQAFIYGGIFAGIVGIVFAIGSYLTNGAFFQQLVLYNQTIPAIRDANTVLSYWTVAYLPMIPLAILAVSFVVKNKLHLLALFAGVALIIDSLTVMRPGAGPQYFFEAIFAIAILAGAGLYSFLKSPRRDYLVAFGVTVLLLIFNASVVSYPDDGYAQRYEVVKDTIADARYPILSENWGIVLEAGKEPYCDPFVFYELNQLGYWDEDKMLYDLKTSRIEYVITQYPLPEERVQRLSGEVQAAVVQNYTKIIDYSQDQYGLVVYKSKFLLK